jgi:hypothetical protein
MTFSGQAEHYFYEVMMCLSYESLSQFNSAEMYSFRLHMVDAAAALSDTTASLIGISWQSEGHIHSIPRILRIKEAKAFDGTGSLGFNQLATSRDI